MFVLVLFGIGSAVVPHKSFHATIECRPIVLRSCISSYHIIVVVVFLNDGREVVEQSRVIISQIKAFNHKYIDAVEHRFQHWVTWNDVGLRFPGVAIGILS